MEQPDHWYQELSLKFPDGTCEVLYLDMSRSGRHKPRPATAPAEWTQLSCHKCSCCTLLNDIFCPAALSLEETLLTLRSRKSTEIVTASALDSESRRTSVTWPLQEVGAAFVQLAVFSSGCPVGNQFRPMVRDLRPFATSRELGKHLVYKHLLQHKGDAAASAQAVTERLMPLREVFSQLHTRLQMVPLEAFQDAIPNSIVHMHAMTLHVGIMVKRLVDEIMQEMR